MKGSAAKFSGKMEGLGEREGLLKNSEVIMMKRPDLREDCLPKMIIVTTRNLVFLFFLLAWPLQGVIANPLCDGKFWQEVSVAKVKNVLAEGYDFTKPCEGRGDKTAGYLAILTLKDPSLISSLIEGGVSVKRQETDGRSVLHAAVRNGHPSLIVNLIARGADPNLRDERGMTPLNMACRITDNRAVIEALVSMGAKKNTETNTGETCFYYALINNGRYEIIRYLLQQEFPTTYENCKASSYSEDPCHPAISVYLDGFHINYFGDEVIELSPKVIDLLASEGFNVNARLMEKPTFLSKEPSEKYFESTPLRKAIRTGNKDIIKALLNNGADINQRRIVQGKLTGNTPIFEAIDPPGWGRPDHSIISFLVFNGAELNTVAHGSTTVTEAIRQNLATLKFIVDLGANIELRDKKGNTPLLYASYNGDFEAAKYLLSIGANVNATNSMGQSVLHLAAKRASVKTLEMLIQKGADARRFDNNGYNLLHLAARHSVNPDMVTTLIKKYGFNPNSLTKNDYRNTPLILAAIDNSRVGVMNALLRNGANPNLSNAYGFAPIHAAAAFVQEFYDNVYYDNSLRLKLLLEAGANVNAQVTSTKETALHIAADQNAVVNGYSQQSLVELIDAGANVLIKDENGATALDIYKKNNGNTDNGYRGRGYWKLHDKHFN